MKLAPNRARLLLHFGMTCAVFPLLYVVFSSDGDVWVERSLRLGMVASIFLCGATLVLAILEKSKRLLIVSIILLALWFSGLTLGAIGCTVGGLSGGYDRYTNCGIDLTVYIGLVAFSLLIVLRSRSTIEPVLLLCLVVPLGFVGAHFYLLSPLKSEISLADFSSTCIVRQPNYYASPFDRSLATRIRGVEDLNLGWVIGEQSPRIYRLIDGKAYIWRFSQRVFVQGGTPNGLADFCGDEND